MASYLYFCTVGSLNDLHSYTSSSVTSHQKATPLSPTSQFNSQIVCNSRQSEHACINSADTSRIRKRKVEDSELHTNLSPGTCKKVSQVKLIL